MLRRVISAVSLIALASAPVAARTRLFCRFSGVEITDCAERQVPDGPLVQADGCCDRRVAQPLGAALGGQQHELAPPALTALPAPFHDVREHPAAAPDVVFAPAAAGPPVFLITCALLI